MKTKSILTHIFALSLATTAFNAVADDNGEDNHQQGGHIEGHEKLQAKIFFVATTNAPAGAGGKAHPEAENEEGVESNTLEVETHGLIAGDYVLSAVKKSDGSVVDIGQLTITSSDTTNGSDDGEVEDNHHSSVDEGTESEVELPLTIDPLDIAQLILSDSAGNPILVADFVNPAADSGVNFRATVNLTPSETEPDAKGKAVVRVSTKKQKHSEHFTLVARNLPANTTLDVVVNDSTVATVTTNKKGKCLIKSLPVSLSLVHSVQLVSQGTVLASANF